jgi:hypothetical protein
MVQMRANPAGTPLHDATLRVAMPRQRARAASGGRSRFVKVHLEFGPT